MILIDNSKTGIKLINLLEQRFSISYCTYHPDIPNEILIFQWILNWLKIQNFSQDKTRSYLARRITLEIQDVSIQSTKTNGQEANCQTSIDYTSFEISIKWINTGKVTIRNLSTPNCNRLGIFIARSRIFYSWQIYSRSKT